MLIQENVGFLQVEGNRLRIRDKDLDMDYIFVLNEL